MHAFTHIRCAPPPPMLQAASACLCEVCACVCEVGGGGGGRVGFVVVNGITPHHQHPWFVTGGIQCHYYCSLLLHTVSLSLGWASTSVLAGGVWHRIRVRSASACRAGVWETAPVPDFIHFGQCTVLLYSVCLCSNQGFSKEAAHVTDYWIV